MEELSKTFLPYEIIRSKDLNSMVHKTNEIIKELVDNDTDIDGNKKAIDLNSKQLAKHEETLKTYDEKIKNLEVSPLSQIEIENIAQ